MAITRCSLDAAAENATGREIERRGVQGVPYCVVVGRLQGQARKGRYGMGWGARGGGEASCVGATWRLHVAAWTLLSGISRCAKGATRAR